MDLWLRETFWSVPCRLQDPTPHGEAERIVLPRRHRAQRDRSVNDICRVGKDSGRERVRRRAHWSGAETRWWARRKGAFAHPTSVTPAAHATQPFGNTGNERPEPCFDGLCSGSKPLSTFPVSSASSAWRRFGQKTGRRTSSAM